MHTMLVCLLTCTLQPQVPYKPGYCFSALSADHTAQYMQTLNEMRRSARAAASLGGQKIGRLVTGQEKLIEGLIDSLKDEHVCWNVKVNSVAGDKIGIVSFSYVRFGIAECSEPWVKKLKKGDMITIKGIVTKLECKNRTMIEVPIVMVIEEITSVEQYKSPAAKK